jgi:hypothetical protein
MTYINYECILIIIINEIYVHIYGITSLEFLLEQNSKTQIYNVLLNQYQVIYTSCSNPTYPMIYK